MITLRSFALIAVLSGAWQAQAQNVKASYSGCSFLFCLSSSRKPKRERFRVSGERCCLVLGVPDGI